jgi:hypothetical protein
MIIRKLLGCTLGLSLLTAFAPSALADISYTQRINVDAAGGMSLFASEGEIQTQISGEKSRSDSRMTMKSKLVGMFAGSGESGSIVRLDKSLIWNLSPADQQYSELTFAQAAAQLAQARQAMQQSQAGGGAGLPVSAEGCQWTEGKLEVEHPGDEELIAGIPATRHIIRMRQTCTDPQTNKACDITWLMETWQAAQVPAEQEVRKFREGFATAMGLDDVSRQVEGPAQGLLAMFATNWDDVVDEFGKMQGYPLRTVMQMGIGGEQCTTASGQPIALDEMWADASTAAYNAAVDQAGSEAGYAVGEAAGESLGGSIAGSIGGAAVGAAAGKLIGGLTGMFKQAPAEEKPAARPASTAGAQVTAFRISTEVTQWSDASIAADRFEVPSNWRKQ